MSPDPHPADPPGPSKVTSVAITGSSGLIGTALVQALLERGTDVVRLTRAESAEPADGAGRPDAGSQRATRRGTVRSAQWDPASRQLDPADLEGVDAVVNLAGAGVGDRPWTAGYRRTLRDSRLDSTTTLGTALAELPAAPRLLSGSAIGYYGDRGDDVLTEESGPGEGFLPELCRDWESATWQAEQAGCSVAHLRTGLVLSRQGGALGRIWWLGRLGLLGPLGSGQQFWPWITLHDHVRALLFLLDRPQIRGAVNLVGPHPTPQRDVMSALGKALHRPAVLPTPAIALRTMLGGFSSELLDSRRLLPAVLSDHGFFFEHASTAVAMAWVAEGDGGESAAPEGPEKS